ncbi:auxin-responsive protein SAUR64-like [Nymphaea colorata]|uniref:auxin-responsive protein SAUR64-like n=1 Tax=Nymphaea colorata TaxID=210225 RepID=UPI00129E2E0B|nr:auxin-responsive protein SAUR64-like [Nymphaea colorata]
MAKKWQKMAAKGRKRIASGAVHGSSTGRKTSTSTEKGHFVAYASDGKRYMVPLACLHRPIFRELLDMAEEEYGLNINGAITLPFDFTVIDYIMLLLRRDMSTQTENALLASLSGSRCSSSSALPQRYHCQYLALEGF